MTHAWNPASAAQSWPTMPPARSQVVSKRKIEPAAITALVLALISIGIWFIPAIIAIVLASGAKRNIKASPETRKGAEFALAAQLISILALVLTTSLLVLIAFF